MPDDAAQSTEQPWRGTLGELERLQEEIDDDLTHGRISAEVYQEASERIALALESATEPLPASGGRGVRVVGIPTKEIDTDKLAMVYWMQASRLAREKREREAKAE